MKNKRTISLPTSLFRYITALTLCFTLIFLTGVNFFVYSSTENNIQQSEKNPSGQDVPSDGKTSDLGSNINIQEEYVHEFHLPSANIIAANLVQYAMHNDTKYAKVHFELIAPPPDL